MTALATVRENAPHRLQIGVKPLATLLTAERREHEAELDAVESVERDLAGIHHLLEQVEVHVEHERRVVGRVHVEREEETAHVVRHREQVVDVADRRRVPRVDCAHAPMDVHPSEDAEPAHLDARRLGRRLERSADEVSHREELDAVLATKPMHVLLASLVALERDARLDEAVLLRAREQARELRATFDLARVDVGALELDGRVDGVAVNGRPTP